jgi:hypothetical protein
MTIAGTNTSPIWCEEQSQPKEMRLDPFDRFQYCISFSSKLTEHVVVCIVFTRICMVDTVIKGVTW